MSEPADERRSAANVFSAVDLFDPVIEAYQKHVDRTLLRKNLRLTIEQRVRKAQRVHKLIEVARGAARRRNK